MANTLEVGLNTGTFGYFQPNTPFKDLIKNSPFGWRINQEVDGINYSRLYYVPSSFSCDASGSNAYYTSVSSDENGWPTSLAYGNVEYFCINEMASGAVSAIFPPSSTDNANEATFHVLWDGQGAGGARGWRVRHRNLGTGGYTDATVIDVSAGEAKITGINTNLVSELFFIITSTDSNDHIRNVRIIHQDYRDSYESDPFLPEMVNYYKSMTTSNGPVRNMKWNRTNESQFGLLSAVAGGVLDQSSTLTVTGTPQGNLVGMSYAYQCRFANTIERDLWININYLANDATVSAIASIIATELDSSRKVYVELGNEWWNTDYPYNAQRDYFYAQAEANGGSSVYDLPEWRDAQVPDLYEMSQAYGVQRSIAIFSIFDNYFSSDRLVKVLAGQLGGSPRNKSMLLFSGAYNHVDVLAVNPYVGSPIGNNVSAASAIEASSWNSDDLFQFMYDAISSTSDRIYLDGDNPRAYAEPLRKSLTDTYNMLQASSEFAGIKIIGYEGGHHLNVNISLPSAKAYLINLIGSTKYDSRWSEWNQYLCSALAEYNMVTHAHFVDMSNWSPDDTTGVWEWFGVIPYHGIQTPTRTGLETYVAGASSPIIVVSDGKVNRIVRLHF